MNSKCLYDKGNVCYILTEKECEKCKFFRSNTEKNRIKYIEKVKEEIKEYAQTHRTF